MNKKASTLTSLTLISAFALTACAENDDAAQPDDDQTFDATGAPPEEDEGGEDQASDENDDDQAGEDDAGDVDPADRAANEVGGPETRLAVTYDDGVAVIDGTTLETLETFDVEGFVRVNPAGDGRHIFLTEGESFRLLDAGTWGEPHGEHNHYYVTEPYLSEVTVDGDTPGHVVAHDGIGTLFFDGSGEIHSFELADLDIEGELSTETAETDEPHHGVAVVFADGSRFETLGDPDEGIGARVIDADGEEAARSEDCPGVHGEAAGPDGVFAVGCEDGALIWDGEQFQKIDAGPEYARTGNLFPHPESPIFLGDYRTDQEDPMTEIALINAETLDLTTSEIDAPYNFRSLARGPEGEALVLAEDGQLHVIDPETGEHAEHLQVIDEWTEPEDWQQPRPLIRVVGEIAYITDPDAQEIHMVDLASLEIINTGELDFVPNEVAAADARPAEGTEEYDGDHDEHDHGDHDHDDEHDDEDHEHGDHDDDHGDHDHDNEHDEDDH